MGTQALEGSARHQFRTGLVFEEGPLHLTGAMTRAYGEVNADCNAIHYDADAAERAGFRAPIAHGAIVAAYMHRVLERMFGRDWLRRGSLEVRFRGPAYVGESLLARGTIESVREDGERLFVESVVTCVTGEGRDVLTGRAVLFVPRENLPPDGKT